jgi:hypothetical protein
VSKIIIQVAKGGKTVMTVEGVPGAGCRNASDPYRKALAGEEVSDKETPEMHLPASSEHQNLEGA